MSYDTPTDMAINENRQVYVGEDGDMATVEGFDYIAQSLVIAVGDEIREIIGGPLSNSEVKRLQSLIARGIQEETFVSNISYIEVMDVGDNTVEAYIQTEIDDETITIEL